MNCNSCTSIELYCCSESICIGTAPDSNGSYYVRIEDVSNGRITILPVTIDSNLMYIDVSDIKFPDNHSFELILTTTNDVDSAIAWEINSISVECLNVKFKRAFDADGNLFIINDQVIVL